MNHLLKIAQTAIPGTGVLFRKEKYGNSRIRSFLRDVLALANAAVDGPRYIVVGANFDSKGQKVVRGIDAEDFSGNPSYQSLANEYIEPPVRIQYSSVDIDGERIGVFEIGDCQDRPYMMRIDYSEKLRRGDAYVQSKENIMKMGRRQLGELFERKFRDSVSSGDIEIGFPGEIIHKDLLINTCDLSQLPSAEACEKLNQLIDIRRKARNSGSTSLMARLTHTRLFGTDDPYVNRSPDELMEEVKDLRRKYRDKDNHFLFESRAERVQMVVYNQAEESIIDASLSLIIPSHNAFYVADRLPKAPGKDGFVERFAGEIAAYPSVTLREDSVQVTSNMGDIAVGEPVVVFESPLRLCIGKDLSGRRFRVRYSLHGQNLRSPTTGELTISVR